MYVSGDTSRARASMASVESGQRGGCGRARGMPSGLAVAPEAAAGAEAGVAELLRRGEPGQYNPAWLLVGDRTSLVYVELAIDDGDSPADTSSPHSSWLDITWRDRFADVCGQRPRLAGSGSTWFVEGEPAQLGLDDREYLTLDGEVAPLCAVGTLPPSSED